jgi:hypothetical protein
MLLLWHDMVYISGSQVNRTGTRQLMSGSDSLSSTLWPIGSIAQRSSPCPKRHRRSFLCSALLLVTRPLAPAIRVSGRPFSSIFQGWRMRADRPSSARRPPSIFSETTSELSTWFPILTGDEVGGGQLQNAPEDFRGVSDFFGVHDMGMMK